MNRLTDKVVLITGGARGQGAAEAALFAAEGAIVVATDILDNEGEKMAAALGERVSYLHHDVTSGAEWRAVVASVLAEHGRIDGLVNNAGIAGRDTLVDTTEANFEHMVKINQVGVFLGMQAVSAAMISQRKGSIVNISSTGGMRASAGFSYGATKWAIRGMTKTAAMELGPSGIRVNSVHPGVINTPMFAVSQERGYALGIEERIPLRRIGEVNDIAYLVLFLISDESGYCTGAEYLADGGVDAMGMGQR